MALTPLPRSCLGRISYVSIAVLTSSEEAVLISQIRADVFRHGAAVPGVLWVRDW